MREVPRRWFLVHAAQAQPRCRDHRSGGCRPGSRAGGHLLLAWAMPAELQRGAGPWHAEWQTLTALLQATGGAAARVAESLSGLQVDAAMARSRR